MRKFENVFIASYGVLTVVVFLLMIYFGGLLNSVNTLLYREISFLISPYSLQQTITVPLYQLYNFNLFIFSFVLLIRLPNIFAKLGALYLIGSAIIGLLLIHFPMDPRGFGDSLTGNQHILVAALQSFCIVIGILYISNGFTRKLQWLSQASHAISIIILLAGLVIGVFALFSMREYVGLLEKLPIAAFMLWILLTSWGILQSDNRINYAFFTMPTKEKGIIQKKKRK